MRVTADGGGGWLATAGDRNQTVGLSFIRRTGVVLLLLLFASFVFLLLFQLLSCALLNLYFRICTLYLLEYDSTS